MYTLYKPQSEHKVAIAYFWSTFHHDGKIRPGWWGCRGTTTFFHSTYHHVQSAVYAPAERADTCPYFISTPICTLRYKLTINEPVIYTAPCIMFWMCAYPLRGQVGEGWALEFESFLDAVKCHRTDKFYAQELTREVSGPILRGVEEQVHKGTWSPCSAPPPHYKTY